MLQHLKSELRRMELARLTPRLRGGAYSSLRSISKSDLLLMSLVLEDWAYSHLPVVGLAEPSNQLPDATRVYTYHIIHTWYSSAFPSP